MMKQGRRSLPDRHRQTRVAEFQRIHETHRTPNRIALVDPIIEAFRNASSAGDPPLNEPASLPPPISKRIIASTRFHTAW